MNINEINIIEVNAYSFQFQVLKECTIEELQELFHISKKKWNQQTIRTSKKGNGSYPKDTIFSIDFFIPELKETSSIPIQVLYEDSFFLAVYKPAFLLVHDDGNEMDTLQARVNDYLLCSGWPFSSQALHRIDFEASGIVLFSKHPFFQGMFDKLVESHECIKEYYAKVNGLVSFKKKTIDSPISRNRHNAKAMIIHKNGKPSISHVTVLKKSNNQTLCKVLIETGRKHQIRLHLSSIGHPIINDPIYGTVSNKNGLLLENFHMAFLHPVFNHPVDIEIELDKRF